MTQFHRIAALLALAFVLGGCTSKPVYNAKEEFSPNLGFTQQQMSRAIVTALNDRQWVVQSVRPGMIKAAITVRGRHHAEVDIPFSPTSFEIDYRSSYGLDAKDGKIHGNYNRWVNRLRDNVLKELSINPDIEFVNDLGIVKQGADEPTYLSFREGVKRATDAGLLDGSVKFYLAGETLPKQVRKLDTVSSSRKTNGSNKSDADACFWALQSALATLQNAAKKADANAVINIASVDQRDLYKDTEKFQCRAGLVVSSVALRGDLAHVD
ncbi:MULTISPECIES: hypothetical protein [Pseudomonas]|jgi:uncharacterized protein YbjQ (UPF0145 family)|uniref:Lipoprotein n=1 Tax=Pseudomonas putida TaxID=303 RepID=A0A2C5WAB7_PSEPU|nr:MULTISPECIES: hypothetical protein [Pseudomonas]MBB6155785.1 uncharacterized protein YbjQ (UPF0145 family) [Pseudomonas sp. JAI115]PHH42046.1 hypothetical protein CRX57_18260 [Pseudomonas putida]POA23772.1 hypothetical protein C1895_18305 [Pseudomonas sp. FW305-3-2-15-E-TSA4]POA38590.1 hypothetical protein C1894_20745 [Pseudomonas sp. FW305-3-2-15-E-TSA2]SNY16532.1 hypothetical protein SAMN05660659_01368 [Pseudomonas sp. LAMO17WK12:I6]